ncbi:hypothetical protein EI42_03964 [Thermosporothrix hazakensis]|jgi:fatty acid desaturase|uniref:Uncharacterized protein n=2 Tax=Thermosporothrix TaxID=768650 RepID=A0A326U388_THEHA|nr:hypothetical protein [Thermosporothrix hazakensis]PZW26383.1 hypothetical protein EI42_03964 [Thermosporothrix hazakensis]BBH90614.1 hypothetical protein KTC_53650 [Thermosporothrix sp. COM3]GCE48665.1 hypothetical protein KTH_35340 [Thermosporothrix hazakensis]
MQHLDPREQQRVSLARSQEDQARHSDEEMAEKLAHRVVQLLDERTTLNRKDRPSAGQRLVLALASLVLLLALGTIFLDTLSGVSGLIAFGILAITVFMINAVFNDTRR